MGCWIHDRNREPAEVIRAGLALKDETEADA